MPREERGERGERWEGWNDGVLECWVGHRSSGLQAGDAGERALVGICRIGFQPVRRSPGAPRRVLEAATECQHYVEIKSRSEAEKMS